MLGTGRDRGSYPLWWSHFTVVVRIAPVMIQRLLVFPDRAALVQQAYQVVVEQIHQTLSAGQSGFRLVLAGGSTPQPLYSALAKADLPWAQLHIFWGDERYVPTDHPDSNQQMARVAWLDQVPIPRDQIYGMPTASGDPVQDAIAYEQTLRTHFGPGVDWPCFDLILLGMGDDGHTASLFPFTDALQVCDRWVTVGQKDGQPRLTLTIPVLNQAKRVIFLVAGAGKQKALEAVLVPETLPEQYPARFVQPQAGETLWLLDAPAAATLSPEMLT